MKSKLFAVLSFVFIFISLSAISQTRFALHSNGQTQVFNSFANALAVAQHGDTIYLPGGNFNIGNPIIDKKIIMIGAGHYPAFTLNTGITLLQGNLTLLNGAHGTQLQGFYLTGDIRLGTTPSNQEVNHVSLTRLNVQNIWLSYNSGACASTTSEYIQITENIVRNVIGGGSAQNVLISKNIIGIGLQCFNGNVLIRNNVFLSPANGWENIVLNSVSNASIHNNIFLANGGFLHYACNSLELKNNIFTNSPTIQGDFVSSGNLFNVPHTDIFLDQSGHVFSYEHNYHLKPESGGIGAGTDGTDIGIHGTSSPYKEGAVPYNPRFLEVNVPQETPSTGILNISIEVEAQNN